MVFLEFTVCLSTYVILIIVLKDILSVGRYLGNAHPAKRLKYDVVL